MKQDKELKIKNLSSSNYWDYENSFYWFSHPSRLNKLLAQYELYKTIIHLPGFIFELGVYKAVSLIRLATFRTVLEHDFSRKLVGFDVFGEFPKKQITLEHDIEFIDKFEEAGGFGLEDNEIIEIFNRKKIDNFELIKGNIFDTIPKYLSDNSAVRIAFLHLDMDVKEPSIFALENLWTRVVPNGLVVFDNYNTVAGETDAVDEFALANRLVIEKTNLNYIPSFIRKPV